MPRPLQGTRTGSPVADILQAQRLLAVWWARRKLQIALVRVQHLQQRAGGMASCVRARLYAIALLIVHASSPHASPNRSCQALVPQHPDAPPNTRTHMRMRMRPALCARAAPITHNGPRGTFRDRLLMALHGDRPLMALHGD